MNRNDEWAAYMQEVSRLPVPDMEKGIHAAMKRTARDRITRKTLQIAAMSAALICILFYVLVNTSVAFAKAMGEVPPLRTLAKLVAQDPSLKAAIDNKYVQPIGMAQTHGGITVNIGYIIADSERLSIFLDIQGPKPENTPEKNPLPNPRPRYDVDNVQLWDEQDAALPASAMYGYISEQKGLQEVRFDLLDGHTLPLNCSITLKLRDEGISLPSDGPPKPLTDDDASQSDVIGHPPALPYTWDFSLSLDPALTRQASRYPLNTWVTLEGQRLLLEEFVLSPTIAKLRIKADPENTAVISGLHLSLTTEKGEKFIHIKNGISGFSSADGYGLDEVRVESSYFSNAQSLTLGLEAAGIIPKEQMRVTIDAQKGTVENLPEYVQLESMKAQNDQLHLSFIVAEGFDHSAYQVFSSLYKTADGIERTIHSSQVYTGDLDKAFRLSFSLEGYANGPITLTRSMAPIQEIEPIEVPIY